jgi:hypothetical protein
MIIAQIDRDYITNPKEGLLSRVGKEWFVSSNPDERADYETEKTRFRCKDDDGEIYYGGWLLNDSECIAQQIVLEWARVDAGCTTIEVKIDEEWKQEIS